MDEYEAIGSAYLGDYLGDYGQDEYPEDQNLVVILDGCLIEE